MRFRSSSIIFPLLAYFSLPLRLACFSLSLGLACVSLPLGASENVRAPSSGLVVMAAAQPDPKTPNTSETPAIVDADSLTGKPDGQIEATGNVILHKDGQTIRADHLTYSPQTQELDARGAVVLEQDGSTVSGPQLKLNLDTRIGNMEQPQFYLKENDARGSANIIHIRDRQHYLLEQATYTTCPADNDDWLLKMSSLEIDRDRQIGTARHTRVEFMGMPILYTPWMNFPLNNQRKSGFLAPIYGATVIGGSELTLPYYWNIAPNYDMTVAPRAIAKRGLLFNNEFRYLGASYFGEVQADTLRYDAVAKRSRDRFGLKHQQALPGGFNSFVNYNRVSDDAYFKDLSNTANATSQVNLLREGGLGYNAGWGNASVRAQRFQTLQDPAAPIVAPYARLPQVTLNAQHSRFGATLALAGEYVDFSHPTLLNGRRTVLNPSVSYPLLSDSAFYITPKIGLHSTRYSMGANNTGLLKDAYRSVPIYSVDSGVAFEREGRLFGSDYVHTLEPRAFYVYVPYREQAQLPNFDSAQADFNFTQMFAENRFFGNDRIGDANQITLAATTRWLEQSNGAERLKVTVGERFSFAAPQVNLVTPAASTNKSDILMAVSGQVTRAWSLDSEFQFDPNQSHTQRYNLASRYRPEPGKAFNLGYRFTRNISRLADISAQWPLFGRWQAVGRWSYSLHDARILETITGLEYNQECWAIRLVAQRFATATQQYNTGIFIQLELSDLLKVGADPLSLLKQSVPGYAKMNEKPAANP